MNQERNTPANNLSGTRAVVVGAGSIGLRHHRVLTALDAEVAVVSRRPEARDYESIDHAIADLAPTYVVLATETERHLESVQELASTGYSGHVLLEKPVLDQVGPMPELPFESLSVGYQLRFHPAVRTLRSALAGHRVLSAQFRYGQYLPDWRPGRDYRTTVTAGPGGGVLLELSHELDLINWLLGPARVICGRTSQTGTLEMEREDLAVGLLHLGGEGLASFELNSLDRIQNRTMKVTAADHFFELDLIAGSLKIDNRLVSPGPVQRDDVFAAMHRAVLADDPDACSLAEAIAVLNLIEDLRAVGLSASE